MNSLLGVLGFSASYADFDIFVSKKNAVKADHIAPYASKSEDQALYVQ